MPHATAPCKRGDVLEEYLWNRAIRVCRGVVERKSNAIRERDAVRLCSHKRVRPRRTRVVAFGHHVGSVRVVVRGIGRRLPLLAPVDPTLQLQARVFGFPAAAVWYWTKTPKCVAQPHCIANVNWRREGERNTPFASSDAQNEQQKHHPALNAASG